MSETLCRNCGHNFGSHMTFGFKTETNCLECSCAAFVTPAAPEAEPCGYEAEYEDVDSDSLYSLKCEKPKGHDGLHSSTPALKRAAPEAESDPDIQAGGPGLTLAETCKRYCPTNVEAVKLLREMEASLTNVWEDGEPEFRAYYSEIPKQLERVRDFLAKLDGGR